MIVQSQAFVENSVKFIQKSAKILCSLFYIQHKLSLKNGTKL